MRRTMLNILVLTSALALSFMGAQISAAPRPHGHSQHAAKKEGDQKAVVYRVIYRIDEIENGKTIDSHSYTIMVKTASKARLRITSRVPYGMAKDAIHHEDIGMKIDCAISKQEGSLVIHTKLEMTSRTGKGPGPLFESIPVFGELQIENATFATVGKPALVASAAAIDSNRHYVVEVTVTNAR